MKKPVSLRAHLTQWVPDLAKNPEKLHLYINKGRIVSRYGTSLSFEYRYQLEIIITDFAQSTDVLIVPLLVWIQTNQPSLLLDEKAQQNVIAFEAEILDNETVDLQLTLDLTEMIIVAAAGNSYTCTHRDEPALPDLGGPVEWTLYLNGQAVTE